jgi:hypothetical protein
MSVGFDKEPPTFDNKWDKQLFTRNNIHTFASRELAGFETNPKNKEKPPINLVIVAIDGDNPSSTLGREVEWTVFNDYFKNDLETLRREYEVYDSHSIFFVALDAVTKTPAGVLRLITPSKAGLKSLHDIADTRYPWKITTDDLAARMDVQEFDISRTVDIATLAIKKEYRTGDTSHLDKLSALLYYAMYQWSLKNDIKMWVGILDTRPLGAIQNLGSPLDFFKDVQAAPYIGSGSSIPFYADLNKINAMLEKEDWLANFFLKGEGIDPGVIIKF